MQAVQRLRAHLAGKRKLRLADIRQLDDKSVLSSYVARLAAILRQRRLGIGGSGAAIRLLRCCDGLAMRSSKISNSMLRSALYACAALSLTKASPSLRRSSPSFSSLGESAFGSTKDRRLARGLTISRDTVKPISEGAETEQKCTRSPLTYTQQSCFVTGAPSGRNGNTWIVMPRSRRSGGSRKFSSTNGFALQVLTSSGLLLKPTGPNSLRFPLAPKSIPVLKSRTCTNHLEGT